MFTSTKILSILKLEGKSGSSVNYSFVVSSEDDEERDFLA